MSARMSYLGPAGTFTEQALRSLPDANEWDPVPAVTVADALQAVREGEVSAAIVPMENSVEGAVSATMDNLVEDSSLMIVGEALLEVAFGLFVRPGVKLSDVETVASHPHAYAQCRGWLRTHAPEARFVAAASTADAAEAVYRGDFDAAICAAIAGEKYSLIPVAEQVADNPGAITRFVRIAKAGVPPERTGVDVTSLVLMLPHDQAGSLQEALTQLAVRNVNLTRIESRPTKRELGIYWFFLDCSGHIADARVGEAVAGLRRIAAQLRFLGSYPRAHACAPKLGPRDVVPKSLGPVLQISPDDYGEALEWVELLRVGGR